MHGAVTGSDSGVGAPWPLRLARRDPARSVLPTARPSAWARAGPRPVPGPGPGPGPATTMPGATLANQPPPIHTRRKHGHRGRVWPGDPARFPRRKHQAVSVVSSDGDPGDVLGIWRGLLPGH